MKRWHELWNGDLVDLNAITLIAGPFVDKHYQSAELTGSATLYWMLHLTGSSQRYVEHSEEWSGEWTEKQKNAWQDKRTNLEGLLMKFKEAVQQAQTG